MSTFTCDANGLKTFALNDGSQIVATPGMRLIEINGQTVAPPAAPVLIGIEYASHAYTGFIVTYGYALAGDVLSITIEIENNTKSPLVNPVFQLPALSIPSPTTNDFGWGEQYVRTNNEGAPDFAHPTHAFYDFNGSVGSSLHVKSHFYKQTLVDCNRLYINDVVPAHGTLSFQVVWNITTDTSLAGLFGPYKADYDAIVGPTAVPSDNRVCFQAYVSTNPTLVDPANNKYGYQMIRPDTAAGISAATAMLAPVIGKTQGMFIVDPQGVQPRGQQIRSEWFDTLPPETATNLPALFQWGEKNGVGIGIGVRPSAVIVPQSFATDESWLISPEQFVYLGARINNALAMGMTGPIYIDSLGYSLADAALMTYIRIVLGPAIKTYTEAWNALTIRDSGIYVEIETDGVSWSGTRPTDSLLARFLQPNVNVIALNNAVQPATHIAACKAQNIAPLFDAYLAPAVAAMALI